MTKKNISIESLENFIDDSKAKEAFKLISKLLDNLQEFQVTTYSNTRQGLKLHIKDENLKKRLFKSTVPFEIRVWKGIIKFYIGAKHLISDELWKHFDIESASNERRLKFNIKTTDDVIFLYKELFIMKLGIKSNLPEK